jgi:sugar/nucleoside kinase (ribokinase family)
MKRKILIPVVLLIAIFSSNCEKDDICSEATSTTPRLIMQFYNINDPTTEKIPTSLLVTSNNGEDTLAIFTTKSRIELPLKIMSDITEYRFTLNSNSTTLDNTDDLTFNYTRENVFVSRACGYKTIFVLDPDTPFVQDNGTDNQWMQNVTVEQPNILNENEVHVSVLF